MVLGISNDEYGEVPVAVVKTTSGSTNLGSLKKAVADALGEDYALHGVFELHELGMDDWPLNPTGKVMKMVLKERLVLARLGALQG